MRERLNLNYGWKFHRGDITIPKIKGHFDTYMHAKAQNGQEAAARLFYDGDFEKVNLPHDYIIEGNVDEKYNESQGSCERANAWYRRNFLLDVKDANKRIVLLFEGMGMKSTIWINGHKAGINYSMYNSFYIDITPYVTFGNEYNTIAVYIECNDIEGWWYEGGGIYRNVWLIKTADVAVDVWGDYINPQKINEKEWEVEWETSIYNIQNTKNITVHHTIIDVQNHIITESEENVTVENGTNVVKSCMKVSNPNIWDLQNCYIYKAVTKIEQNGVVLDTFITEFGFRTIHFDAAQGFFLNDQHLKLRGVCLHQDHGNLGTAVPRSVLKYRLLKLKEAGINSIRCAHHNPSPDLLEICDSEGLLVIDENRWFNFSHETKEQLKSMCKRDRNHPCVIMWSLANEEPLQNTKVGMRLAKYMKNYVRQYDTARPITYALNGGALEHYVTDVSDVLGINYMLSAYQNIHETHPGKPIVATESGASCNNRGIYFNNNDDDGRDNYATAYDKKRVEFGSSYTEAIKVSEQTDYICGTFLWTGIEYRGEAAWPNLFATMGLLDSCGMEKDNFYLVKSFWTKEPMIHIATSWDFPGCDKKKIPVYIYSNVEEVEVFVNGRSLGIKKVIPFQPLLYNTLYTPGNVRAIGYIAGKAVVQYQVFTAGEAAELILEQKNDITNNGEDAAIIEAYVVDKDKHFLSTADSRVYFETDNCGEILAVSGGDPLCHENTKSSNSKLFAGRCQAVIKIEERAERCKIRAHIPELKMEKELIIYPVSVDPLRRVEECDSLMRINEFRKWPIAENWEAIDATYDGTDMNTSEPIQLKQYNNVCDSGITILTSKIVIPQFTGNKKVQLRFNHLRGKVKIKLFHEKNCWPNPAPKEFRTIYKELNHSDIQNSSVLLEGFGKNEKLNIVLAIANDGKFKLESVDIIIS